MILKRDDGTEIDVDYTVTSYGSLDSWTDPGDPAEVEIEAVADLNGNVVELTDAERERIEQELAEIAYSEGPPPMDDDV